MSETDPHNTPGTARGTWRRVTLLWCVWLLVAWALMLRATSVAPAARWMVLSAMMGMMAAWPVLRLSQGPSAPRAGRGKGAVAGRVLGDWVSLMLLTQMMLWPLWLSGGRWSMAGGVTFYATRWSATQTALTGAALAAWSLLTAAILAWGLQRGTRSAAALAAAACVLLLVGEPLVYAAAGAWSGEALGWASLRVSPVATLWGLTEAKSDYRGEPWVARTLSAALAAAVAWIGVAWMVRRRG